MLSKKRVLAFGLVLVVCNADLPKILSCVAGLPRCIGVPDVESGKDWGCPIFNNTEGKETLPAPCVTPQQLKLACAGQGATNFTGRDGTPVTFSHPVDMDTVKPEHFAWHLSDGRVVAADCAFPNGAPAAEPNEGQTIAIVGDAGGWSNATITKLEIVGALMLVLRNGTKMSAQGMTYNGDSLVWDNGVQLLDARLEPFSTSGETLKDPLFPPQLHGRFPNHCQVNFPATTHRIRLLFNGGVTHDGTHSLTPDNTDFFRIKDARGAALPAAAVLGLADLGTKPAPADASARLGYKEDGDNYLDICLDLGNGAPQPAAVDVICDAQHQISLPKGLKRARNGLAPHSDPTCKAHTVAVLAA